MRAGGGAFERQRRRGRRSVVNVYDRSADCLLAVDTSERARVHQPTRQQPRQDDHHRRSDPVPYRHTVLRRRHHHGRTRYCSELRKCADTTSTVPVPCAGRFPYANL